MNEYRSEIVDARSGMMKKLCMAVLSAYPIICYFKVGSYFNYGSILGLLLFFFGVSKGLLSNFNFSKQYYFFWAYQWVAIALFSGYFGLNSLIPGGLEFFTASLGVAAFSAFFDLGLLRKYTNVLFIISGSVFLFQYINQIITGNVVPIYPHLGDELTYCGMNYNELVVHQMFGRRPCSIFPEPAYFAIFCCFSLTLELFCEENLNKLFTPLAVVMGLVILLSKSGTGLLALAVIGIIKLLKYYSNSKERNSFWFFLLILPALYYGIQFYINSEIGIEMMSRKDELSGNSSNLSGYMRIVEGFMAYFNLSSLEMLFGTTSKYYETLSTNHFFLNGIADTLVKFGAFGLLFQIILFSKSCKGKQFIVIANTIVFYFISFIESMNNFGRGYITALVMITTLFLNNNKTTISTK